jgi:hypothetical protein
MYKEIADCIAGKESFRFTGGKLSTLLRENVKAASTNY